VLLLFLVKEKKETENASERVNKKCVCVREPTRALNASLGGPARFWLGVSAWDGQPAHESLAVR